MFFFFGREYLFVKSIGRFWGNFSHFPDQSFSTEFSIFSIYHFWWNLGNYSILCLNISYLNNFPALHAEQKKNHFFAEDFWAYVFSAKIFSNAPPLTKNVVFDGIWGELICYFWWNLGKSNRSFYKEFCTKLKINASI